MAPNHLIRQELTKLTHLANQELTDKPIHKLALQLKRIKSSIPFNTKDLEPIQHFKFPPWNRNIPYTVNIRPLPKEEAAIAHKSDLSQFGQNDFLIYTDVLSMPGEGNTGIGIGLVVL